MPLSAAVDVMCVWCAVVILYNGLKKKRRITLTTTTTTNKKIQIALVKLQLIIIEAISTK